MPKPTPKKPDQPASKAASQPTALAAALAPHETGPHETGVSESGVNEASPIDLQKAADPGPDRAFKDMAKDLPPVFTWLNLTALTSDSKTVDLPDLEIKPGQAILIQSQDDQILSYLALLASGQSPTQRETTWFGQKKPPLGAFQETLNFYRRIALVSRECRFLANVTLLESLCFELEYNQDCAPAKVMARALETLEWLGLTPLANLATDQLTGPTKYVSHMAAAISRRPGLYVLDRPVTLLGPLLFDKVFETLKDKALPSGAGLLILGHQNSPYQNRGFDRVIALN
ncbi:MAG: hypothetical protein LBF38_08905 [Deltaproteobacteria bacterium]|jgi:ABC-type ATPase involved in cell division|nr:hypothetical protein [Deltaproteobacteria bacterium]